ncbi:MAG TPA: hypothetical protein VEK33_09360 [Terriglobales bacterium]|nr:hypothetical protein [Terriglobales bacterium]
MKVQSHILVVSLILSAGAVLGQQTLNDDAVVKMAKAGLSDDVIVATIKSSPGTYSLSPNDLINLKQQGLSDKVLAAMIEKNSGAAGSPSGSAAAANPDDPATPHDAGVYALIGGHLSQLDAGSFSQQKTSGVAKSMFTGGLAKMHMVVQMSGAHSPVQLSDPNAAFYVYIPPNTGFNLFQPTSVNDFTLILLDVKGDHRQLSVMASGAHGSQMGPDEQHAVKFTSTKIGEGIYKITPRSALTPGEYCFASTVNGQPTIMSGGRVWDFDISNAPK